MSKCINAFLTFCFRWKEEMSYKRQMKEEANHEREMRILEKMGPKTQVFYILAKEIIFPIGAGAILVYYCVMLTSLLKI